MKRYLIIAILLVAVPCLGFDYLDTDCNDDGVDPTAVTWCVSSTETTLSDIFCGGGANSCAGKTVYLEGGTRTADLDIQASGTSGNYITITNYPSDARVVFNKQDTSPAIIFSNSASWIDLRGDGLSGNDWVTKCTDASCYGIVIQQEIAESSGAGMIRVEDSDSDNIKIGYIEIDGSNHGAYTGTSGIQVQSTGLTSSVTLDSYEIHHIYVHDIRYAGLYLGNNDPVDAGNCAGGCPYLANFLIHDNLFVDIGAYGIGFKGLGIANTDSKVYNNYILPSNRASGNSTGLVDRVDREVFAAGLGISYPYGQEIKIYNNWVEKAYGTGINLHDTDFSSVTVYNNVILGCGTSDDSAYGGGILYDGTSGHAVDGINIFNNTIVDPVRYGIITGNTLDGGTEYDNLIVNPGIGYVLSPDVDFIEGTGDFADTEKATGAEVGFVTWDGGSDYSAYNFDLASGHSVGPMGDEVLTTDYDGNARGFQDGAYGYDGVPTPPWSGVSCQGCGPN